MHRNRARLQVFNLKKNAPLCQKPVSWLAENNVVGALSKEKYFSRQQQWALGRHLALFKLELNWMLKLLI